MTVFDTMAQHLVADSNLASAATYTPAGGDAISLNVVEQHEAAIEGPFSGELASDQFFAIVSKSDVAAPKKGDTLTINGTSYTVSRVSADDSARQFWRLELEPA